MRKITLAALLAASPAWAGDMPVNPAVSQDNIGVTICVKGYSKSIRPPQSYTRQIKLMRLREAGLPPEDAAFYELDHRIAIAAGGDPNDPRNLTLQPWSSAKEKDRFENRMHTFICDGRITLREAQEKLWNWTN